MSDEKRKRWRFTRWLLALIVVLIAVMGVLISLVIRHAEPILRARVIQTLSSRFRSRVELDGFHVSVMHGLQVSGEGLRIFGETDPNSYVPGIQPIIAVAQFQFGAGIAGLFRSPMHVSTVYLKGLQLNLPPRERWAEMKRRTPQEARISIVVDSFVSDMATLVINTAKPGKLPLDFEIESLKMTRIGSGEPLDFEADLINPKPVGKIHASGKFGPWQADEPRNTDVSGAYTFRNADLSTIKGIGGILSSTGNFGGVLDRIVVDGATETPDFRIAIAGTPVPLHTDFHATVDGTTGDTYLQPVKARLQNTWLIATGSVVRTQKVPSHHIELDVQIDNGRIEDLLKLAVRREPPLITGTVRLKTKFDLPPGDPDVANRLQLAGTFEVGDAHFTNAKIQERIDSFSMRSQGKSKLVQDDIKVESNLGGTFGLSDGILSFSQLHYEIPGTQVELTGSYSLERNRFDFHGKARLEAKLSQMVTGWKSVLLRPVDPFLRKNGVATEIPIRITGNKSDLHFGTDFGHKDRN
jgi:hypothetical protein